jgi:hypothetical protein
MISKNSTAVLAVLAVLSFSSLSNAPAADANSKTAIDAVASKDGFLRSALDSADRSENQLRERFGKDLAALNEARLKALQQAFDRASGRRDTESVASLAAIISTMKSEGAAESLGAKPDDNSDAGKWEFLYKGQRRQFDLARRGSFQGQYPVSGKSFSGDWKREGEKIVLTMQGESFATISGRENEEAKFRDRSGYEMVGRKIGE